MASIEQILDYLETEKDLSADFIKDVFFKWYFKFDKEEESYKRANFVLYVYKRKSYKIAECEYNTRELKSFTIYFSPTLRACKIKYYTFYIYRYMDELLI